MTTQLPLASLEPHPGNANRLPPNLFAKLVAHIADSGAYPPIIVRPAGSEGERYQILDGHHRVRALAELGHTHARCDIWEVDDTRATLLLLTLNRLEGSDDPFKRATLIAQLAESADLKTLEARLPEDRTKLAKLLELLTPVPPPAPPDALVAMPHAITFFLTAAQRDRLISALSAVHDDRSAALVTLLNLDGDQA